MTPMYRMFWVWLVRADAGREVCLVALGAVAAVILAACGRSDVGPWKEEVELSDGRVIVVERFETLEVETPIGDPGSAFIEEARIKVLSPIELKSIPELVMRYRPVIFDYDAANDLWFAIGVNDRACWAFDEGHMDPTGRANLHPNFEFRLIDGAWQSVEIGPERLGLSANLLIQRTTIEQFDVLPLSEKARVDSDRIPQKYRQIVPLVAC